MHTVAATNNVQWSARLAVLPAVRGEKVEVADVTNVVKLVVTFATTVTARRHQGRAEEEVAGQQGTATGNAVSMLDSGESAPLPPQALPVKVERLTDVPDPPELVLSFKDKLRRSLDLDPLMPMATMLGNYKFNSLGEEHRGRVLDELGGAGFNDGDQQSEIFGGGRFGKVSLPEILTLDSELAYVSSENSATEFRVGFLLNAN